MSAGLNGIGPVAVRYAVQIQELLQTQAIQRMTAEQEAARAAQQAAADAARNPAHDEPVKIDVKVALPAEDKPAEPAAAPVEVAPAPVDTKASTVDITV